MDQELILVGRIEMHLDFIADGSEQKEGFDVKYETRSVRCPGYTDLLEASGTITSNGWRSARAMSRFTTGLV